MKSTTSFQERAELAMEQLSKQQPVTIEEARAQVKRIKDRSSTKIKKKLI